MPRGILSDHDRNLAAELREQGKTFAQIARFFVARGKPVTASAISYICLKLGADGPPARRGPSSQGSRPLKRGDHIVRPFTAEEDEQLLALRSEGLPVVEIGRRLGTGRRHNSLAGRLLTLARREARAEEAAQQ
jgi:hypothetical protein